MVRIYTWYTIARNLLFLGNRKIFDRFTTTAAVRAAVRTAIKRLKVPYSIFNRNANRILLQHTRVRRALNFPFSIGRTAPRYGWRKARFERRFETRAFFTSTHKLPRFPSIFFYSTSPAFFLLFVSLFKCK